MKRRLIFGILIFLLITPMNMKDGYDIILSASSPSFDGPKAVEYANAYHNQACSDKFDFRDHGYGDCAHYVSCCVGKDPNHQGGGIDFGGYKVFKPNNVKLGEYYGIAGAAYPVNGKVGEDRIRRFVDDGFWDWQLVTFLEKKNYIESCKNIDSLSPGDIIQYSITNGWCEESGIKVIESSDKIAIGSIVKTTVVVRKTPNGSVLANNNKTGIIEDGPRKNKEGKTCWNIRFDNGAQNHVVLYLGKINNKHAISDHLFNGGSVHGKDYMTILNDYGYNEARFFTFKDSIRKNPGGGEEDKSPEGTIKITGHANLDSVPYTLYQSMDGGSYSFVTSGETSLFDFGTSYEANCYYKIAWGEVRGYTKCPDEVKYLQANATIEFNCVYRKDEDKSAFITLTNPQHNEKYKANTPIEISWQAQNLTYKQYLWYRYSGKDWQGIASDLNSDIRKYDWIIPPIEGTCEVLIGSGYPDPNNKREIVLKASDNAIIHIVKSSEDKTPEGTIKITGHADLGSVPYTLYRSKDGGSYSFVTSGETSLFDFGTSYEANCYYKIAWGEVRGYIKCPDEVKYLQANATIEFNCVYRKDEDKTPNSRYEKGDWFSIGPNCYYYRDACGRALYPFNYENGYCIYEKRHCNNAWWYKIWMQDDNGINNEFVWIRENDINRQISQPLAGLQSEHYFKKGSYAYEKPCGNIIDTIKYDGNKFKIIDRLYRCNTWWYKVYVGPWQKDVWFKEEAIQK